MKIFNSEQLQQLDKSTIINEQITSIDLMERAAKAFYEAFATYFDKSNSIAIYAGCGNNGGDALAIARILITSGYDVKVVLCNPNNILSADCETNKKRLLELVNIWNIQFIEQQNNFHLFKDVNVIIDGLFGIGLNRPIKADIAELILAINNLNSTVISIDVPSGLFIDKENCYDNQTQAIIKANQTITFQCPKLALLLPDNADFVGKLTIVDIGLNQASVDNLAANYNYIEQKHVADILKIRKKFSHKGNFGHALLIAGSINKIGAAVLAAKSCMRSGVGLLTVHVPEHAINIMQTAVPEAMLDIDSNINYFSDAIDLTKYNSVGIGCGIGLENITADALFAMLKEVKIPLIIDADALNLISLHKQIKLIPQYSILTPHVGELNRLLDLDSTATSYQRLLACIEFANAIALVILKGSHTAICLPNRECFFNSTGNPGMATAGSGDVLTGLILGLLAQGYKATDAAILGVYLHGLAGDFAAQSWSQYSLIASDIINHFGDSFQKLLSNYK